MTMFDGSGDFSIWKKRMYANLSVQGLKDVLTEKAEDTETKDEDEEPEAKKKREEGETVRSERDEKALNLIFMSVGDQVLRKIDKCTTAAQAWSLLDRLYMTQSLPNRVHAQLRVYSFKMQDSRTIDQNMDDFLKMITDLSNLSIEVPEEVQAILLLNALPARYDSLKETLKYGRDAIKVEEVASAARSKELEFKDSTSTRSNGEGHYVRGRTDSRTVNFGRNKGRSRSKSKESKRVCWICGKEGHFKKQCYKWLERNKGKSGSFEKGEASAAVRDDANDLVGVIAAEVNLSSGSSDHEEWVLDTGCSFHMTPRRDLLRNFREEASGRVRMANGSISEVTGIGSVRFRNPDNTTFLLHDVKYMPTITRNLISLGTLEDKGCEFKGGNGVIKVIKGCIVFMKGMRRYSLYILQGDAIAPEANVSENGANNQLTLNEDETRLWHSRMGHIGQKGLEELAKRGCFDGKRITEIKFCETCVLGKTTRSSFGPAKHVTRDKLDYIHSDLWGSPNVPFSLNNCQYFISFTDDFSRKVWVYFLKHKDEAFRSFCEWKKMVETQTERKVKKLRTDNGLEFCNRLFDGLCKEEGIVRHRTCTYTSQQNGVAERLNRSIMNKVRCMLSESGLEKKFWAEAASTAVYLINRSPSYVLEFKVPEELWTSVMPTLTEIKRFGCLAYIHSDDGKLNPRAKRGVFTGYPEGVKGFRVWIIDEMKITITRNVIFREDKMYKDLKSDDKDTSESRAQELKWLNIEMNEDREVAESSSQGGATTTENGHQGDEAMEQVQQDETIDLTNYQLARDRVRRQINPPTRLDEYECDFLSYEPEFEVLMCLMVEDGGSEPNNMKEAVEDSDSEKWIEAAVEEMTSLKKNKTWILVDRPKDQKAIGCRWLFKRKPDIAGVEDPRHKARLVAKGYSQKEGIDYQEIFAPVVKHVSIRYMLSAVTHFNMELQQMDVKTAFLHGNIEEHIVMEQPEGFVDKDQPDKVCLLKRSLYGLKQSPRQWNKRFDDLMQKNNFQSSQYDNCVYFKNVEKGDGVYLLLYVDDILIASQDKMEVEKLKILLSSEFEMKDLGDAKKILGMEIERDRAKGCLWVSQESYFRKVLNNFKMDQCKSVATPLGAHFKLKSPSEKEIEEIGDSMNGVPYQSAVGSIMYAMIGTRPDLAYPVGLISRFMSNPVPEHWSAVKWVLRYIQGTIETRLCFKNKGEFVLKGYCDSDYGGDLDERRSVNGIVFTAGGNTISWRSQLQKVVALSSTEAEYISMSEAIREGVWLKGLAEELGFGQETVDIFCDSQSAIALSKNAVFHERSKHVATKYHYGRDLIKKGVVHVLKIATANNPADVFTKVLPVYKVKEALKMLRIGKE